MKNLLRSPAIGTGSKLIDAQLAWLAHPGELASRMTGLATELMRLQVHSGCRVLGMPDPDPVAAKAEDERFTDVAWSQSAAFDAAKEWYLAWTRHTEDMLYATPGIDDKSRRQAAFWARQWLNAIAPTNFLWTNPVAQKRALETGGRSLEAGMRRFLGDVAAGTVRMTDPGAFKVGENIATTPGAVVFRNRLLEVLHYAPTRPQVHAEPVVLVVPWINKFYVLDLNPRKSLVRYLLDQGYDVFITSWRNPDASLADVGFGDYLTEGVDVIVNVARSFTGAKRVHAVGYCIGGTALAMYMAWANRHYGPQAMPVADWTLFNTLVDFGKPGDIEVFIDEASVARLVADMERKGFLDGASMASTFRLLRSNSLIWHYVVHGWLYGEEPPPSDVLYWNIDTTRMPAAQHSWYLRELYLENRLVEPDALELAGQKLDLRAIRQPLYAVAAEDDHITPWEQTFRVVNLVRGGTRFVLTTSGHILGIINPPVDPPKRRFWAGEAPRSVVPAKWRSGCDVQPGTWWPDWMAWLGPRAGAMVPARPAATREFPELAPAPGTYVFEH
ncbi:MAG: alpha/beta fold hydrolase [Burkholderiales bacterium]